MYVEQLSKNPIPKNDHASQLTRVPSELLIHSVGRSECMNQFASKTNDQRDSSDMSPPPTTYHHSSWIQHAPTSNTNAIVL